MVVARASNVGASTCLPAIVVWPVAISPDCRRSAGTSRPPTSQVQRACRQVSRGDVSDLRQVQFQQQGEKSAQTKTKTDSRQGSTLNLQYLMAAVFVFQIVTSIVLYIALHK